MLLGAFVVKHDLHNHLTICASTPIDYDNRDDKLQVQNQMQLGIISLRQSLILPLQTLDRTL